MAVLIQLRSFLSRHLLVVGDILTLGSLVEQLQSRLRDVHWGTTLWDMNLLITLAPPMTESMPLQTGTIPMVMEVTLNQGIELSWHTIKMATIQG